MLDPAALHGLAGQVVRSIEPYTEADPAGLLLCFLVMLGNAVSGPRLTTGGDEHPGRLFGLLVGDSSVARKGTAISEIGRLMRLAAPDWSRECQPQRGVRAGTGAPGGQAR